MKDDEPKAFLHYSVGPHVSGGIGIQFPAPVKWVVLSREQALDLALALLKHAHVDVTPAWRGAWSDDGNTNYPGS